MNGLSGKNIGAGSGTPSLIVKRIADDSGILSAASAGTITRDSLLTNRNPEETLGNGSFSKHVLLSLAECDMIDSAGVSWLIRFHRRCEEARGRLVIHSIPPVIERTLRLLNMQMVFSLAHDEAAARELIAGDIQE